MADRDPVTFELIRHALAAIGDEMARTMVRCAYSPIVRNSNDYTTGILNTRCEIIGQGNSPVHLRSLMDATEAIRQRFSSMEEGDVFIVNDPYDGGSHLPDLFLVRPVFYEREIVGFSGSEAHHADLGGRVVGSNAADSKELYEEGLIIPPSHLVRKGELDPSLWNIILRNTRFPDLVAGDLGAQMTALEVGAGEFYKLLDRYGKATLFRYVDEILDYTETLTREEIATWPDGTYRHVDYIDDDGISDVPIPVTVQITVKGSELKLDFSGTGEQVATAINNPGRFTGAVAMAAARCALSGEVPHNSGFLRPITVEVPEGSILNPRSPAAVSARTLSAFHAFEATVACLAQFVPHRMTAGTHCSNALVTFSGENPGKGRFIYTDIHFGSWGARASSDGIDGLCSPLVTVTNTPVEVIENEYPIALTEYGLEPDSAGAGKFRGGMAVTREYLAESPMVVEVRSDRSRVAAPGIGGGGTGVVGSNVVLRANGDVEPMPALMRCKLEAGDRLRVTLAGGGGWGDPLARDLDLITRDVREGLVSPKVAKNKFGAVVDMNGVLDRDATATLRRELQSR